MAITIQRFDGPCVFIASRICLSMSEAEACEAALRTVPSPEAFKPTAAPPLSPTAAALIELGDEDAPTAHLKAGEANG